VNFPGRGAPRPGRELLAPAGVWKGGFYGKNWFKCNCSEKKSLQMKRFFLTILVNFVSSRYKEDVKTSKPQRCQKPVKRG
jgi:hypothetical protein